MIDNVKIHQIIAFILSTVSFSSHAITLIAIFILSPEIEGIFWAGQDSEMSCRVINDDNEDSVV